MVAAVVVVATDGIVFGEDESGACVKGDRSTTLTVAVTVVVAGAVVAERMHDSLGDDDYDGYHDVDGGDEKDDSAND